MSQMHYAVVSFPSHLERHINNVLNIINNCEDSIDITQIYVFTPNYIPNKQTERINDQIKRLCVNKPRKCKDTEVNCTICCEDIKYTEYIRELPCTHCFHKKCVDKWFVSFMKEKEDITCPLCRKKIELKF